MRKGIRYAIAAAALAGGITLGQAGPASAAHCLAPDGEEPQPGFSYFGNDHVAEGEAHGAEGGNPGPHNFGSSGASTCRDTGSPSDRAPGQNKP